MPKVFPRQRVGRGEKERGWATYMERGGEETVTENVKQTLDYSLKSIQVTVISKHLLPNYNCCATNELSLNNLNLDNFSFKARRSRC